MDAAWNLTRRRLLAGAGSVFAVGGLAGCADSEDTGSTDSPGDAATDAATDMDVGGSETEIATSSSETDTPSADELDLREANVVGVAVATDDSSFRFEVTLHHDDDGEDGYANWWQVERLDGTRLGRRELLHAHSRHQGTLPPARDSTKSRDR